MSARPLIDMDGRHVAIVGAAGELGAAMTALLLDLGAHVLAIDRDAAALDAMAGPSRLRAIVADVVDEAAMARAFDGLDAPLDGLVNGAGIENAATLLDALDTTLFRRVMDVNVTGMFLGMKYGVPRMRRPGGSIVNIASTAGVKGAAGMSAYVASKHAVIGLTRCAAIDYGPVGLRVNALCPGPLEGRMIDAIMGSRPGEPSDRAKARMAAIPSRRFGAMAEVAQAAAYLLSDASAYVNGACHMVDGGISAI
ncbi:MULTISPECIES: SDR family NAD(P)-dependent oxidoreductase [Sphingobium]|uniref:SDR family oxidoreductase n=1 Tax=Sphingobium cupriresistens TaxID=1132417 RepID=A0A8G1ZFV2_9SPHN|nr:MULTISPECIES: SDR family oxidoreductase [Sphingobium]RYM10868.1 SDR family oxidoreductase [Sphingobium cupriresistens]WCP14826.1 2,5-dichloro-2,5-cyclohexadiene-1,4-diol dehydrogenase [Sphingobium sp. AntQ-1]